jgi:hypothetical protein
MGFPTGTTNMSGLSEHQRRFLLGQAMDVNYLTWIVSLVVAEQKRLASSLVGYMGFYELKAAMEPPPLVMMPSKVVGGEEDSTAHPWDMWSFGSFVTKDRARELHGQNSEFAHSRMSGSWVKWKSSVVWWGWRRWSLLHPVSNSNQKWRQLLQRSARRR